MTDALSIAQAAQLEARAAMTQIASHERECARRYQEAADGARLMNAKLDALLEQGGMQKGRQEQNRALLGDIPNAVWTVVIAAAGSGVTAMLVHFFAAVKP